MTDFKAVLATLRRPRLLIRAARHGLQDYRRDRDLSRLIGGVGPAHGAFALPRLIEAEAETEQDRTSGSATYSIVRHVELLIALMAEARLSGPAPQG